MSLFSLLSSIGWLALVVAVALLVIKLVFQRDEVKWKWIPPIVVLGICMIMINGFVYYQNPGYSSLIQYPTGKQVCTSEAGPHLRWFGNVIEMKKVMTIPIQQEVRFNDSVTAQAKVVSRFQLPVEPMLLCKTIREFRNEKNLRRSALIPATKNVIRNSARLLSAQEYVAGKGGVFESAVLDQLRDGLYVLNITERVTKRAHSKVTKEDARSINEDTTVQYVVTKVLDKAGNEKRKAHSLIQYGIKVTQAEVEHVDPSPAFKNKLKKQMEKSAEAALAREAAKTAEFDKRRIIAEGERDKASKRIEEEKKQITTLIAQETIRKSENEKYKAEVIALKRAKLTALKIKELADAEAYKKRKVMMADGALEKKLEAYKYAVKQTAAALGNKQLVPSVYFAGGEGKGGSMPNGAALIQLMTAKYAQDLGIGKIKPASN